MVVKIIVTVLFCKWEFYLKSKSNISGRWSEIPESNTSNLFTIILFDINI